MTTERRLARAGFTLTRDYPVPRERVWAAFAEEEQKRGWFGAGDTFESGEWVFDFRVGGRDVGEGRFHDGPVSRYEATYTDIVEHIRIVTTYDMWLDGTTHMSTSTWGRIVSSRCGPPGPTRNEPVPSTGSISGSGPAPSPSDDSASPAPKGVAGLPPDRRPPPRKHGPRSDTRLRVPPRRRNHRAEHHARRLPCRCDRRESARTTDRGADHRLAPCERQHARPARTCEGPPTPGGTR